MPMPDVEPHTEPETDVEAIKEARREQDKLRELKTMVRNSYNGARKQMVHRQRAHGRARAKARNATKATPLSPAQIKRRKKASEAQAKADAAVPLTAEERRLKRNKTRAKARKAKR